MPANTEAVRHYDGCGGKEDDDYNGSNSLGRYVVRRGNASRQYETEPRVTVGAHSQIN